MRAAFVLAAAASDPSDLWQSAVPVAVPGSHEECRWVEILHYVSTGGAPYRQCVRQGAALLSQILVREGRWPDCDVLARLWNETSQDGVFVDAGANIGVHTRFLFEPERYRHSLFVHTFTHVFGSIDRRANTTCSIGFEPNPKHVARHEALQRAYAQKGWRYTFIPAALGTSSGELTFYTNGAISAGTKHEDWGFGVTDRVGRCEHDRNCRANVLLNGTLHACEGVLHHHIRDLLHHRLQPIPCLQSLHQC